MVEEVLTVHVSPVRFGIAGVPACRGQMVSQADTQDFTVEIPLSSFDPILLARWLQLNCCLVGRSGKLWSRWIETTRAGVEGVVVGQRRGGGSGREFAAK